MPLSTTQSETAASQRPAPRKPVWWRRRGVAVVGALLSGLLAVVLLLTREVQLLDTPTEPAQRLQFGGAGKALVIIDIQEDYTGSRARAPYPASEQLLLRINELSQAAADAGWPVVYVRQIFSRSVSQLVSRLMLGGDALESSPGASFDRRLRLVSSHRFEKPFSDAFSSPPFEALIVKQNIGELYLVGLDGAGCVDRTARGAMRRGLSVTLIEDAIATRDADEYLVVQRDYPALGVRRLMSREFQRVLNGTPNTHH